MVEPEPAKPESQRSQKSSKSRSSVTSAAKRDLRAKIEAVMEKEMDIETHHNLATEPNEEIFPSLLEI